VSAQLTHVAAQGHAWSADGLSWSFSNDTSGSAVGGSGGGAYVGTLRHDDGRVEQVRF
jgi:hypothetical protein